MSEQLDVVPEAPVVDPVTDNENAAPPVDETVNAESADNAAEPDEGQDDSASSDDGNEGAPKKKGGFQRRIDELTREKYEALQAAEDARQQAAQLRQQSIQAQMQDGQEPFPTLEDAGYDEGQYQRSVQQWYQSQAERHQQAQAYAQHVQNAQAQEMKQANELRAKVSGAVAKYPDYLVKIQDPNLPNLSQVNPAAFEAVTQSEQFAEVSYYLANNPSEVFRFQDLSPVAAVKEIAKLEMKFSRGQSSSNPTPPPPPPSKVTGAGKSDKAPANMDTAEFIAWRNQSR